MQRSGKKRPGGVEIQTLLVQTVNEKKSRLTKKKAKTDGKGVGSFFPVLGGMGREGLGGKANTWYYHEAFM